MSDEELGAFFRGLHAGALATGRQLATAYNFERFRSLLDVGGGSGGVSIAACQNCHDLKATVLELPRVAAIAQNMVRESKLEDRVQVIVADILQRAPEGRFDVAVLRSLIQVLGPESARRALRNVGEAINRGGWLFIVGHVLEDNCLAPAAAVSLTSRFSAYMTRGKPTPSENIALGLQTPASTTSMCTTAPRRPEQASSLRARRHD
jgi:cyclopropane fatty-acyl-phospholipid synthase-like methyltransferase